MIILHLREAFPRTLPVLAGYIVLGIGYGLLMHSIGLGLVWTFLISFLVYAGAMQYAAITLFAASFNPIYAFLLALIINARHLFYGFALLDNLADVGPYKNYIAFALTDETFSLLASDDLPAHVEPGLFMALTAFLCRWYWIIASVIGALIGDFLPFQIKGLEFSLTALFVVIFLNHWRNARSRFSLLTGLICTFISLVFFGAGFFMIPAMVFILIVLALKEGVVQVEYPNE